LKTVPISDSEVLALHVKYSASERQSNMFDKIMGIKTKTKITTNKLAQCNKRVIQKKNWCFLMAQLLIHVNLTHTLNP